MSWQEVLNNVCVCVSWQLPVPAAVFALIYHERLVPCSHKSPRLLAGATRNVDSCHGNACISCVSLSKRCLNIIKDHSVFPLAISPGSLFSCFNPTKLRGHSTTFFILHVLGGAILFITDGIMVRLSANTQLGE